MPDPPKSKASFANVEPSLDVDVSKFYGVPWAREKRNRKRRNRKRRIKANF